MLVSQGNDVLSALYFALEEDDIRAGLGYGSVMPSREDFLEFMRSKYDGCVNYILGFKSGGVIQGFFFVESNQIHNRADVHFAFTKAGRGKILFRALIQFYDCMFLDKGYNTLWGRISLNNVNSLSVAIKSGWQEVCTLSEYFFEHGEFVDASLVKLTQEGRKL